MTYVCYRCRGIIPERDFLFSFTPKIVLLKCPICQFEYAASNGAEDTVEKYVRYWFDDVFFYQTTRYFGMSMDRWEDCKSDVWRVQDACQSATPIQQLFGALSGARDVVHFITYGISRDILGAMKLVATKARVVGIIANVSEALERELRESEREIPDLHFITYKAGVNYAPHTKLVVIDGYVAFDGSTNLTTHGLRQAARKLDRFHVITDPSEVRSLNNQYFSPIWYRHQKPYKRLWMEHSSQESTRLSWRFE